MVKWARCGPAINHTDGPPLAAKEIIMKTCMLALSLFAILGFTGIADAAKGQGHGTRGKISSVTAGTDGTGTFTMTMGHHGKKNAASTTTAANTPTTAPSLMTVTFTSSTTITVNGAAGKLDSSLVGKRVSVIGTTSGNTITATSITITDGHKKKAA